jgi:hypothetical protein
MGPLAVLTFSPLHYDIIHIMVVLNRYEPEKTFTVDPLTTLVDSYRDLVEIIWGRLDSHDRLINECSLCKETVTRKFLRSVFKDVCLVFVVLTVLYSVTIFTVRVQPLPYRS